MQGQPEGQGVAPRERDWTDDDAEQAQPVRRVWILELTDEIDRDIAHTRRQLREHADSLARDMERLSEKLQDDAGAIVNKLGEVQSRGTEIDQLCRELETLRETRRKVNRALVRDSKMG